MNDTFFYVTEFCCHKSFNETFNSFPRWFIYILNKSHFYLNFLTHRLSHFGQFTMLFSWSITNHSYVQWCSKRMRLSSAMFVFQISLADKALLRKSHWFILPQIFWDFSMFLEPFSKNLIFSNFSESGDVFHFESHHKKRKKIAQCWKCEIEINWIKIRISDWNFWKRP